MCIRDRVNTLNPSAANNVFNAVLNQIKPGSQQQIQPPPANSLPYNFTVPPHMVPGGIPHPLMMQPPFIPNNEHIAYAAPPQSQPVQNPPLDKEASRNLKNLLIRDENGRTANVENKDSDDTKTVSYTHLDVYKRQLYSRVLSAGDFVLWFG